MEEVKSLNDVIKSTDDLIKSLEAGEDRAEIIRHRKLLFKFLFTEPETTYLRGETKEFKTEPAPKKKTSKKRKPVIEEVRLLKVGDEINTGDRFKFYRKTEDATFPWEASLDSCIGEHITIEVGATLVEGIWVNIEFDSGVLYHVPWDTLRHI